MAEKKPWRERLKQDIVILVMMLLLLGGSLSFLSRSIYFVPGMILLVILTFGPYIIEYAREKLNKNVATKKRKLLVKGIEENGVKKVLVESKEVTERWHCFLWKLG